MEKQQERSCPASQEASETSNDTEEHAKDSTHPSLESTTQGQPSGHRDSSAAEASERTSTRSGLHSELDRVRVGVEADDTSSSSLLASGQVDASVTVGLEATCDRPDDNEEKDTKTLPLAMGTMNLADSVQPETPRKSRSGASKSLQSVKCIKCRVSLTVSDQVRCNFCESITCYGDRYPEKHPCKKDYKTDGKEEIAKNNPKITAKKIEKL